MRNKIVFVIVIFCLTISLNLYGLKLPDGQIVDDASIERRYGRTFKFKEPVSLETPLGKCLIKSINFGYMYSAKTKKATYYISSIMIVEPIVADTPFGRLALKGRLQFNNKGELYQLSFEKPKLIDTPAGKIKLITVSFYHDKKINYCAMEPLEIISTSVGKLEVKEVRFTQKGEMKYCKLSKTQTIDSIYGKLSIDQQLDFHPNGAISSAILKSPHVFSTPYGDLKLTKIFCSENRKVIGGDLTSEITIDSLYGKLNVTMFKLNEEGKLIKVSIVGVHTIETSVGQVKVNNLYLNKNGGLFRCYLIEPQMVQSPFGKVKAMYALYFDYSNSQNISMICLAEPTIIKTPMGEYNLKCWMDFEKDGKTLSRYSFAEPQTIEGKKVNQWSKGEGYSWNERSANNVDCSKYRGP